MSALTQVVVFLSNKRIAIFFRFAAIAGIAAAAVSPVSAQNPSPTLACVAPLGFARFDIPLKRVAERISARQPITIVAIGSSSTFGTGASSPAMSYPSRLAVELRALLPQTPVTVINRGVNGETAQEMLARFDRDVLAAHPDLVLWQVGSNAVLLDRPIAPTGFLIDEGLRQLKVAGFDVVLIDPQYAPKVIAKHDEYDINLMVALISTASRDMHVNLFQRFALMRYWRLTKGLPFSAFLSKDELHMNDWSYGCIAKLLARAVAEAAARVTVR
jgi:acyl-CoA thioesterase-1